MDPAPPPSLQLEQFYRLALLLGGSARSAEPVLAAALAEMPKHAGQLRSLEVRQAWLAGRIRQRYLSSDAPPLETGIAPGLIRTTEEESVAEPAPLLAIEAYLFAQRFSGLAEPGRSALALFYLDLLPTEKVLTLLGLNWDRYCEALVAAREELKASIQQMRTPQPVAS